MKENPENLESSLICHPAFKGITCFLVCVWNIVIQLLKLGFLQKILANLYCALFLFIDQNGVQSSGWDNKDDAHVKRNTSSWSLQGSIEKNLENLESSYIVIRFSYHAFLKYNISVSQNLGALLGTLLYFGVSYISGESY